VRDVESLREHYPRTLRAWLRRLEQSREAAIRAADETVYRTWRMYLAAAAIELEKGTININQTLFERPLAGRPAVPPTRADLYS
jgi:cyclopropane-fatty-acyl-phospholipid synthase